MTMERETAVAVISSLFIAVVIGDLISGNYELVSGQETDEFTEYLKALQLCSMEMDRWLNAKRITLELKREGDKIKWVERANAESDADMISTSNETILHTQDRCGTTLKTWAEVDDGGNSMTAYVYYPEKDLGLTEKFTFNNQGATVECTALSKKGEKKVTWEYKRV